MFWFATFDVNTTNAQVGSPRGTPTPLFTPQPTHMPYQQKPLIESERRFNDIASQIVPLSSPVRGTLGDWWADVVIGQPDFGQITPNEVVANKLFNPGGVFVDRSAVPNRLYVYDAGNSRVLGFSSLGACVAGPNTGQSCTSNSDCPASSCSINSNKSADIILGQPSADESTCNGDSGFQTYPDLPVPSASTLCGLRPESTSILEGGSTATMATDPEGNFYHPDYFNNRVLRYDNPFTHDPTADYVWGQSDFNHAGCNEGRSYGMPNNRSLCLAAPMRVGSLKTGVAIDSDRNLWVADTQNNRVLRFPYDSVISAPSQVADLVLGQNDFSTAIVGNGPDQMRNPGSVRVGADGKVYVLDGLDGWGTHGRLLVFVPPLSNGMAASQVYSDIGEPSSLEWDPDGDLWLNNSDFKKEIWRLTNGQLQKTMVGITGQGGSLGIDRDKNIFLTGWGPQQVQIYDSLTFNLTSAFVQANSYGTFNQLGPRGLTDPTGLEVTDDQLIVADSTRLLFWNNPRQLTNNFPPADGVIGQPDFVTRPRWGLHYGRMRADTHGKLWVLKGDVDLGTHILAYQLPLQSQAVPLLELVSPLPLKGGINFGWSGSLDLGGIAYQPECDCLWLSDLKYSRVFRINQVSSPNRVVDIVLGQSSVSGIHCNQGRDSDDGNAHPQAPSQDSLCHPGGLALDQRGNLFVSDHNLEVAGNWRMLEYDTASLPLHPSTAIFGLPASRVYGRNGSFTDQSCQPNDPMCGPWEPVFYPNHQMVVGFNTYVGTAHPQVYQDPLMNPFPYTSLGDFYSHAYSARLDSLNNLYVLDLTRNHILVYRAKDPPPPVVLSIERANPSPIAALQVSFNVTFSETVLGVDSSDFVLNTTGLTGATITDISGTGTTRRVVVNTGLGTGTIRLDVVDDDSIRNEDNNRSLGNIGIGNGDFTNGEIYTVVLDDTPPNAPGVTVPVGFIRNITPTLNGTAEADSRVNVWYRDNSNNLVKICSEVLTDGSGNWSCDSSVTLPERAIELTVKATDASGNTSDATTYSFTIDLTAPPAPVVNAPTGTINDSTPIISGTAEANSKVNIWSQAGASWQLVCSNVTVSGSGAWSCESSIALSAGSVELKVNAMDAAGNQSPDTTHFFMLKLNPPGVTSIVRVGGNPTRVESVDFTVTFSESVKDVDMNDFSLITSGQITGASVSGVTGSEASYTVSVSTGSLNGKIRLDVPSTATITDLVGNALSGLPFTTGETYTIFKTDGMNTTGVFRPSNGLLYLKNKNDTGFADAALNYGLPGDYPVVGDWDGNGTATIGVYRNGYFYLKNSNTLGFAEVVFPFGQPGDQPIAGDWDGDGVDTIGVFHLSNGHFFLRNSNTEGPFEMDFYLGNPGDVGIAGDWDGDGKDSTGVFRPSNGIIFLKDTNDTGIADYALNYGLPGDQPVMGDWDNDGKDTIGIYRLGTFYLRNENTNGFATIVFSLGNPGDMPIAGNWDGLP